MPDSKLAEMSKELKALPLKKRSEAKRQNPVTTVKPSVAGASDNQEPNTSLFIVPFRGRSIVFQNVDIARLTKSSGKDAAMNETIMDLHLFL